MKRNYPPQLLEQSQILPDFKAKKFLCRILRYPEQIIPTLGSLLSHENIPHPDLLCSASPSRIPWDLPLPACGHINWGQFQAGLDSDWLPSPPSNQH